MLAVAVILKTQSLLEKRWTLKICVIVDRGIIRSDVWRSRAGAL